MSGLFSREVEDALYYFAVKSSLATFAKDFRFKVIVRFFGGDKSSVAFGRNKPFIDSSKVFAIHLKVMQISKNVSVMVQAVPQPMTLEADIQMATVAMNCGMGWLLKCNQQELMSKLEGF